MLLSAIYEIKAALYSLSCFLIAISDCLSFLANVSLLSYFKFSGSKVSRTATDWATHPITRGAVYNVSRKREKQVAEMMQSEQWEGLYNG